jgi:hypothetical protein
MLLQGVENRSAKVSSLRERIITLAKLLVGSSAAGFFIAVVQHYVTFGVHGYGFGHDALLLACFEGGMLGLFFGIPTGLITFYLILQGRVTVKQVLIITLGSMVVGCLGGIFFDWPFAFATPVLTMYIAWGVKAYQLFKETS